MRHAPLLSFALLAYGSVWAAVDVAPRMDFEARIDGTTPMPTLLAARPRDDTSERVAGQRKQSDAGRLRKDNAKARQPAAGAAAQPYQRLVDRVQETADDFRHQNVSENDDRDRLQDPPQPL